MNIRLKIENDNVPEIVSTIVMPEEKIKEIETSTDAAIGFARTITARYGKIEGEPPSYYRIMDGHKFKFDPNEPNAAMREIMNDFSLHGNYEPYSTKIAQLSIKEGDVAVDVGASHGYFTLLLARLVGPKGKVYSFEPTNNQFEYLKKNIELNGYEDRVIAHRLGAWSSDKPHTLKINLGNSEAFPMKDLDSILPEKVDFIKIDCDGAEPEILKGLERVVSKNPQLKMIIEYYPRYIENLGLNPQDMIDFLEKHYKDSYAKIEGDYTEDYYNFFCSKNTK